MPFMLTSDFDYELPPDRIAQHPVERGSSRLMVVDRPTKTISDSLVADLPSFLGRGDVVIINDTQVIPARLYAHRRRGRRFEMLLLRPLGDERWRTLVRPSARARVNERLDLADGGEVILERSAGDGLWEIRCDPPLGLDRLERLGEAPLPPYIERPSGASAADRERYQTVYARSPGAVAAPTAGLHLTARLLDGIRDRGAEIVSVTLHVGLGTFRPVAVDDVREHRMHAEWYEVSNVAAKSINAARTEGRRILCVGTTSVRTLEGALQVGDGRMIAGEGSTELFITPGFRFRGLGALMTNFHLPRSTLLMLVSAFAGRDLVLDAYHQAIDRGYRFYSYGDAMLIL